jgi:hypothetical protein
MLSLKYASALLLALQAVVACGETEVLSKTDSGTSKTVRDKASTQQAESRPIRSAPDAGALPDAGSSADSQSVTREPPPPAQGTGSEGCAQLLECSRACGPDRECVGRCVAEGTSEAQQIFGLADRCIAQAIQGTCSRQCGAGPNAACDECIRQVCGQQLADCDPRR